MIAKIFFFFNAKMARSNVGADSQSRNEDVEIKVTRRFHDSDTLFNCMQDALHATHATILHVAEPAITAT